MNKHKKNIQAAGKSLKEAEKILVMLHGRGADACDILGVAPHLNVSEYAIFAPEATKNTWYPYSFMATTKQNEPWLSSALGLLKEMVDEIKEQGFIGEDIFFLGFSQGACLALEFASRYAEKYGGIVALTGGLIGDKINVENYSGDFRKTPIFIGTGDPDPHVPLERVHQSVDILEKMNADVHLQVYTGRPHTISQDEIDQANLRIFK